MSNCPCGQPLEIHTVRNLSFNCEAEVITCLCGRIREHYEPEPLRAAFIQKTYALMGIKIPKQVMHTKDHVDKYKLLADSI